MKPRQPLRFILAGRGCALAAGRATHGAASVTRTYPATPLAFESNQGRSGNQVQYISRGGYDAFLAKFDATGKVAFSTFLGGNNGEQGLFGVKLDSSGNVYIAGACQITNMGGWDAVVTKIEFEQAATGPSFTLAGVTNAANHVANKVSPGEIIVIFGKDFGPAAIAGLQLASGMVATETGETRVLFDGVAAPMVYAVNGQISCVVPYEVAGKTTTQVVVEYKKVKGAAVAGPVVEAVPAIFSLTQTGTGQGAILNQDYSVNGSSSGAAIGSVIMAYATGEGKTDTPVNGSVTPVAGPYPKPLLAGWSATVGGKPSPNIWFAGSAPGSVAGVFQVNLEIPSGLSAGHHELIIKSGNFSSQAGLTVAVK